MFTRVGEKLARVVHEIAIRIGSTRLGALRGLALHLKALKIQPRDLDQPNGEDAIMAIARTLTRNEWERITNSNVLILGSRWSWIVNAAGQELRRLEKSVGRLSPKPSTFDMHFTSPTVPSMTIYRR